MSEPVTCPVCNVPMRLMHRLGTKEHPISITEAPKCWVCIDGCQAIWSIEAIQEHLERTEHPIRDTVSG